MASNQEESQETNKLQWSDEMTRFLLELITLRESKTFSKNLKNSFQLRSIGTKVKNRLDTLKKQYEIYRRITFGSTGLGFNSRTRSIDAPEHWWKDKIKAYPEATKLRSHPLRFIPLLDVVFRDETVVVEESWQPRRGVQHRIPRVQLSDEEEVQMQNDSHTLDNF
ncbi:hypothetical protein Bca4012_064690 [Brassica carinata]|uniref:Myb/SANT-like domain-containing protein n=1 Tax=Brassica carinata TaxID=52824 RepID=A0A8X7RUQ5_BRACI|nr:hypothetical protein Bca52824_038758 [Brassica carinata]